MSEFELSIKLESSKYNELIVLEKRGDDYGIALAQASQNGGTNYMKWVFPQRRVDGNLCLYCGQHRQGTFCEADAAKKKARSQKPGNV